jgi:putative glutamine amidotransferase
MFALNVWLGGGRAVCWHAGRPSDLDNADGLIIGGGDDISPDIYGGELVAAAKLDPDRDALERRLVESAFERGMPVLGVCRGAQMINVALGGTLHQDVYGVYQASDRLWTVLPKKDVTVVPDTKLAEIAGPEPMRVNALHSQAVDKLGEGLHVAATDMGGMIQAVERMDGDHFALGVQWHPEHLIYARRQRALFAALAQASAQFMEKI